MADTEFVSTCSIVDVWEPQENMFWGAENIWLESTWHVNCDYGKHGSRNETNLCTNFETFSQNQAECAKTRANYYLPTDTWEHATLASGRALQQKKFMRQASMPPLYLQFISAIEVNPLKKKILLNGFKLVIKCRALGHPRQLPRKAISVELSKVPDCAWPQKKIEP